MALRKTMFNKLSEKETSYWSNVFISIAQVLFGIAAVTFFTGGIDLSKAVVITLNLILSVISWGFGWRLIK